jgi:hypothetical protein
VNNRAKRQVHDTLSGAAVRFVADDCAVGVKMVQLAFGREEASTIGADIQARLILPHPSGFKPRLCGEQRCLMFGDHRRRQNFGLPSIRRAERFFNAPGGDWSLICQFCEPGRRNR